MIKLLPDKPSISTDICILKYTCSVIFTKLYNNTIERYFILQQTKVSKIEGLVNNDEKDENNSNIVSIYRYTKEDIDEFFASDIAQKESHTLEESICRHLIDTRNYKPFFKYCKICPKVENINLKS